MAIEIKEYEGFKPKKTTQATKTSKTTNKSTNKSTNKPKKK